MKIDVFMIGLRHIHGTQGGIETHARHLAEELSALGVIVAVAVRKRRQGEMTGDTRSFSASRSSEPSLAAINTSPEPHDKHEQAVANVATKTASAAVSATARASGSGNSNSGGMVKIVPVWSPGFSAFDAIIHTLFCVLYAAIIRPRVVHIHAIGPALVAPLARLLGLRVVATHHGEDYRREKWGRLARVVLRIGEVMQAMAANEIICVSRSLTTRLTARYRRHYTYIPNGVNEARPRKPSSILRELGLRPRGYILTVGRIVPEKRHDDLIEAFAVARLPDMKLVIVGAGETGSDHASNISQQAATHSNVIMAGFREGTDLSILYAHAACFVLPSSHEGMPIVLLEAMTHGCKLVVSDIEAHREFAFAEDAYHVVGDIGDLADKMKRNIRSPVTSGCDWNNQLRRYRWRLIARHVLDVLRLVDQRIGQTSGEDVSEARASAASLPSLRRTELHRLSRPSSKRDIPQLP